MLRLSKTRNSMKDETNSIEKRKYKLVPPEGRWGYVVCAGCAIIFVAGTAHKAVFGLIYNDFLNELGAGTGVVTVVFGVYEAAIAISGFLTAIILKKLSLRQVALIGATIYTVASVFAIFVTSTIQLILTNGLLQGTGLGILSSVAYTSLNSYFTTKRVFCLGICKACLAMTLVIYSLITKFMLTEYGFRGTLAILCAISANSFLGALTLHPVQWHMLKKYDTIESVTLLPKTEIIKEQKEFMPVTNSESLALTFTSRAKNKETVWETICKLLDLTLFKDLVYINIVIGIALTFFSNKTFFILEPMFLDKNKLTKTQIANIMAVGGATDLLVRLFFALSGICIRMNSRYIFYTGALLQTIFNLVIIQFTTYLPLLILTAILGSLKSLVFITQPIVIADYVPIEKYPPAYGFYMLLDGAISFTVGPLIGYIRDYTDSYAVAYSMLAVCNLGCVIPWTIEAVIKTRKRKTEDGTLGTRLRL